VVAVGVGMEAAEVGMVDLAAVGMGLAEGAGFMDLVEAVGFTGLLPMDWAAAGFMGLLLAAAWLT
jgi:hypothetical protein